MNEQGWRSFSYLDALRPEPGWHTDFALLASYSVNLVAFVAALLALAGLDDDRGSGSKVDFANTIESLRNRVRILVQAGRAVAPARSPKVLTILDRFVRDVPMNEAEGSWHPKVALVRFMAEASGSAAEWRLWLGSRNLTRDTAWDVGLALGGSESGDGRSIRGVASLGRELADRAELPSISKGRVFTELNRVRWGMPPGCSVEEVHLLLGGGRQLPDPPKRIRKLTVVSPFLDGTVVGELGKWGDKETRRVLLATQPELSKLAVQTGRPFEAYHELLYLDAPAYEVESLDFAVDEPAASDDEETDQRGLHAKLIYAEHAGGRTLWVGSANATQRGWKGPNVEIVARISVDSEVGAGLEAFIRGGRVADLKTLPPHEEDQLMKRLEKARTQVSTRWTVVQRVRDGQPVLEADNAPHPDDFDVELAVGLLGQPLTAWPRATKTLSLPSTHPAELTELVRCELQAGDARLAWIQRAPMNPPLSEERDHLALSRYLDPRTFLLWIRSLLSGNPLGDGGGDWDDPPRRKGPGGGHAGPTWWAPTIEEVLKAWVRDPESLADVDRKVRRYLESWHEGRQEEGSADEREVITEFRNTWDVIYRGLVKGRA